MKVEEIAEAIAKLPPDQLARFHRWFTAFEAGHVPAVLAAGGRFLTRGMPAKTYEHGIKERTVLIEFDSLAQAVAAHDSPPYQAALAVLGNAAERDLRIVEGVDG